MKNVKKIILIIAVLSILTPSVFANNSVPQKVVQASESVVNITAEYSNGYSSGSGFVFESTSSRTLIATNNHVVEGDLLSISVWISETEKISATIIASSSQKDLCVLELAYPISYAPLTMLRDGVEKGEAVYAIGFPGAADYLSTTEVHASTEATITDGIVSAFRKTTVTDYGPEIQLLQINAAINHGNSGGPLLNADGYVVGINTYKAEESEGIFGAIAIAELMDFLADNAITITEPSTNSWIWLVAAICILVVAGAVLFVLWKSGSLLKKKSTAALEKEAISIQCPVSTITEDVLLIDNNPNESEKEQRCGPPSGKKKTPFILLGTALAILIFLGILLWSYFSSVKLAKQWAFTDAKNKLLLEKVTNIWDKNYDNYLEAGTNLDNREYQKAEEEFRALGNYRDSQQLEKECRYRRAAQLADQNEYDDALRLYSELSEEEYKDATDCVKETTYRKAVYQIYETGEFETAYDTFVALSKEGYQKADAMIPETQYWWAVSLANSEDYVESYKKFEVCPSYSDAQDWINALAETIYVEGQQLYRCGDYREAKRRFVQIDPYLDSSSYLTLISLHSMSWMNEEDTIDKLALLIGFEDAGEFLFNSHSARFFMEGYWTGDCGYMKFYRTTEGEGIREHDSWYATWDLQNVPNGTWQFKDGKFYIEDKARFTIYATSYNSVVITIMGTGKTYTLWRS